GVAGFQVSLLAPIRSRAHENVGGTGIEVHIRISPDSVDSSGIAIFRSCPDDDGLARDCDRVAESVIQPRVAGSEDRLLDPRISAAHEHVSRAGKSYVGGFELSPDDHCVTVYRHRVSEEIRRR